MLPPEVATTRYGAIALDMFAPQTRKIRNENKIKSIWNPMRILDMLPLEGATNRYGAIALDMFAPQTR